MTKPDELNGVDVNPPEVEETPVVFRRSRRREPAGRDAEITAVFPCDPADYDGYQMTCYAHVGQHSGCDIGWYNTTRAAKPEEYAALKAELESIGYKLRVYKRIQPAHRDARRATADAYRKGLK